MTGDQLGDYDDINSQGTEVVKSLHEKYLGSDGSVKENFNSFEAVPSYGNGLTADEVIQALGKDPNAGIYYGLIFSGDYLSYGNYESRSDAELALVGKLGFYSDYDKNIMDQIFSNSKLYVEKWDRTKVYTLGRVIANRPKNGGYKAKKKASISSGENGVEKEKLAEKTSFCTWDDTGNAERFKILFGDRFRYNTTAKEWFVYNGKIWKLDDNLLAEVSATKVTEVMKLEPLKIPADAEDSEIDKLRQEKDKFIKKSRDHTNKMNMLKSARSLLPITESKFDQAGNIINLQNGYYDLDKDEFLPHEKNMYLTLISNAKYNPKATCPKWIRFINETFLGDVELIDYVQRVAGYALTNSTKEKVMFILFGETHTGKSVFTNTISHILNTYSSDITPESLMVDKNKTGGSASPSLAKLKKARFVTTSEVSEKGSNRTLDASLVKRVTGNDPVTARFLNQNEFTYVPEFKIFMGTNYRPYVGHDDSAMWGRLVIIPFENEVVEMDQDLTKKLKLETDGILNWMLEGHRKYKQHGLKQKEPTIISNQRMTYRKELDLIGRFIEERCTLDPQESIKSSEIYATYKQWAEESGEYVESNTKFSLELGKRFEKVKKRDGMTYLGISV